MDHWLKVEIMSENLPKYALFKDASVRHLQDSIISENDANENIKMIKIVKKDPSEQVKNPHIPLYSAFNVLEIFILIQRGRKQ